MQVKTIAFYHYTFPAGGTTDGVFIEEINFLRDIFVVSGIMNLNPGVYEI